MEFRKWHDEQWFRVYHPLVTKVREIVPDLDVLKSRLSNLWTEFQEFRRDIYGNGKDGYVKRVVKEEIGEMKEFLSLKIHEAIKSALEKHKAEQEQSEEKTRDKWDGRLWAVVIIIFQFILAVVQAYFIWRLTQ